MRYALLLSILLLGACQTTEEKVMARLQQWAAACGYQDGQEILTPDQESALRACVLAHENAYQAERTIRAAQGMAMLGYGAALMATPPARPLPPPAPALSMDCTTTSPAAGVVTTRCR